MAARVDHDDAVVAAEAADVGDRGLGRCSRENTNPSTTP
jgi:hypothetical protein